MKRNEYNKQLIKWAQNHYWDSLENNKDLILLHLNSFVNDNKIISNSQSTQPCFPDRDSDKQG